MKFPQLPERRQFRRTLYKLDQRRRKFLFRTQLRSLYVPGVCLSLYYLAAKRVAPKHARAVRLKVPQLAARWVLLLNRLGVEVRGAENIEKIQQGPLVFFANHNSRMDAYVLLAHLPFAFRSFWSSESHTFKEEHKVIIWIGRSFDMFFFHDKSNLMNTVREFKRAKAFLDEGGILGFFPEGRMHADRTALLSPFGVSCMSMAIETGATVLPITLANTEFGFERPYDQARRPTIMSFGKPFSTAGKKKTDAPALTDLLHKQMLDEYRALRADTTQREAADGAQPQVVAQGG